MSEIKLLDNLRKLASDFRSDVYKRDEADYLLEIADEIQAEIVASYMRLPCDADGVPIHVGDVLECHANGYEGTFTVFAIANETVVGNHEIEWIQDNPNKWFHVASFCHHVKPRTLEDILGDYVEAWDSKAITERDAQEITAKYADRIRELMKEGGDD